MGMTQTFATNADNDIFIASDGRLSVASNVDAVLNACRTAALSQRGEMVYESNRGIPNFQITFAGNPNLALFEAFLRETIESVNGVIEVAELETNNTNNVLTYSATIKTIYGSGSING